MIALSKDKESIKSILFKDEIFETISDDGFDKKNADKVIDGSMWFLIQGDNEHAGVFQVKRLNAATAEIHANILKKYRKGLSRDAISPMLKIMHNLGYHKYTTQVPLIYMNVVNYCKMAGFTLEGVNRMSFLKNGELCDQAMLGITRNEIERLLWAAS